MQRVRVACNHVRWYLDLVEVRNLVLPQGIHQRVALRLGNYVFLRVLAEEAPVLQLLSKTGVRHAATHHQVAIDVTHAFPWVDRRQVWRLFGGGEPLRHREVGGSAHPDFAAAPWLFGQPFDQVVAVATLLAVPQHTVAVGIDHTANVRIADRVALRAPICRIWTLELLESRNDPVVQTDHAEHPHHAGGCALPLAIWAKRDDGRHLLCTGRSKYVDVDRHTVAQLDGNVLIEHDVDRDGPELRRDLKARLQGARTRIESGQEASSRGRQRLGRQEQSLVVAHGGLPTYRLKTDT